jgi:hypothetical protein
LNRLGNGGNTAVRHWLTQRKPVLVRIIFLSTITVLFGGIIEETTTAFKVGRIIGCAAGISIDAEKRFGHRQFGDKGVRNLFAVG